MKKAIIFFSVFIIWVWISFAQSIIATKVGEWGVESYMGLTASGNYIYEATSDRKIKVIDVSSLEKPYFLDGYVKYKSCEDMTSSGNYLYVVGEDGLVIIDISNPARAVRKGSIAVGNYSRKLAVSGNYVYVWYPNTVSIFQVSDPNHPVLAASKEIEYGYDSKIFAHGNYLYLTHNDGNGFKIYDISDHINLVLVGTYSIANPDPDSEIVTDMKISGNYVYAVTGGKYILVIDISDPSSPLEVARVSTQSNVYGLGISGSYIFVLSHYKLQVFDISSPSLPVSVTQISNRLISGEIVVTDRFICVSDWNKSKFCIIDISDPAHPVDAAIVAEAGFAYRVFASGNNAYLAHDWGGMKILDLTNPTLPHQIGGNYSMLYNLAVDVKGDYAYLANAGDGMSILDISNLSDPKSTGGYCPAVGSVEDLEIYGNYAYLAYWSKGLHIVDISNPHYAKLSAIVKTKSVATDVTVSGDYAYVSSKSYGVEIIKIAKPYSPKKVGEYITTGNVNDVVVSGKYAYIWDVIEGLVIVDISNPSVPNKIKAISLAGRGIGMAISGKYLFIAAGKTGVHIVDVSRPTIPKLITSFGTDGETRDVAISGNYLYVANGESGKLLVYKLSGPGFSDLVVTSPNGGEKWRAGNTYNITWNQTGVTGNVSIDLFKAGEFLSHVGSCPANAGTFSWTIPDSLQEGDKYKISISCETTRDSSNRDFKIIGLPPNIELSRKQLNFGSIGNIVSGAQEIFVNNSGGGELNWTVSPDKSWLFVTPDSGTAAGSFHVSIDPTGLVPGVYEGNISISADGAMNSPQQVLIKLNVYALVGVPFGEFSTPLDNSTVSGSLPITGWVLDDIEVQNVKIYREEGESLVFIGDAVFVEGARPDVEAVYPDYPYSYKAGWGYLMLTNSLPNGGNGIFRLHAIVTGAGGETADLGVRTITVDNAHAIEPFGAIETPTQGGTASGLSFINWGWVLTPQPNMIPIDGSTIDVWVDGIYKGHPVYNNYREDIATLFPDYNNSNGAVGYFNLDTTPYQNGIHTIYWTATDNVGNTNGIGSRFFYVLNSTHNEELLKRNSIGRIVGYEEVSLVDRRSIHLNIKEMERVEIHLSPGVMNLSVLPIGSTLDRDRGIFYWTPGPGFIGKYRFIFVEMDENGQRKYKEVKVNIGPKFPVIMK